jgi:hypothetical protein
MLDEIVLQNQVKLSTSSSLGQTVWVYRGSMWAYPWYTSVRKTLEDPAYADWYINFKPQCLQNSSACFSKRCDAVNKTDCSDAYHCQEQSPGYPHGDGDCGAPNCYCGSNVPCGFYIWNHSSTTVVHGQTFQQWFRDTYVFDYQGTSKMVSGFYFDDSWPEPKDGKISGFPDPFTNMAEDMGITAADQMQISKSYQANMATVYAEILKRGMFSWQQQWNGQSSPTAKNGCCTQPLVHKGPSCAVTLRKFCAANSPSQNRVMNYAFSPGSCKHSSDPLVPLTAPVQGRICPVHACPLTRPMPLTHRVTHVCDRHRKLFIDPRAIRVPGTRLAGLLEKVRSARTDQLGLR